MKYFLDQEFIENGKTIELISIAIVAEDGREFYAVNKDLNTYRLFREPWLVENVVPHLPFGRFFSNLPLSWMNSYWLDVPCVMGRDKIREGVLDFVDEKPEFWGYYSDYDWVLFCQLFGRMADLPKHFPMYCRDLKQLIDDRGHVELPKQMVDHHALEDARWIRSAYDALTRLGA